jgi:cell division protein FtsN
MPRAPDRASSRSSRPRSPRRLGAGGTLLGVFIGLVLGLGMAAGVAYYLMKAHGPFPAQGGRETRDGMREPTKVAKADPASEKPRFDFYKILPGTEEPKVSADARRDREPTPDRAVVEQARERAAPDKGVVAKAPERAPESAAEAPAKAADRFWLQAGSFGSEADAENLKARLAFAGWQANVQQGSLPDKGIRYRVRLGPYDNTDELTRIRNELAKNGFEVAVIKF